VVIWRSESSGRIAAKYNRGLYGDGRRDGVRVTNTAE